MVECERVAGGRCLLEVAVVECERVPGGRPTIQYHLLVMVLVLAETLTSVGVLRVLL